MSKIKNRGQLRAYLEGGGRIVRHVDMNGKKFLWAQPVTDAPVSMAAVRWAEGVGLLRASRLDIGGDPAEYELNPENEVPRPKVRRAAA